MKGNGLTKLMKSISVIYCNSDIIYDYCKHVYQSRIKVFIQDKKKPQFIKH